MSHPRAFHTQRNRGQERSAVTWRLQTARIRGWKHNNKGSAASGTQNTKQGDGGFHKRRLDQGFQTRKSFNSQMFREEDEGKH